MSMGHVFPEPQTYRGYRIVIPFGGEGRYIVKDQTNIATAKNFEDAKRVIDELLG